MVNLPVHYKILDLTSEEANSRKFPGLEFEFALSPRPGLRRGCRKRSQETLNSKILFLSRRARIARAQSLLRIRTEGWIFVSP